MNVVHQEKVATIILENPYNAGNFLSYNQLCEKVQEVFGVPTSTVKLFESGIEVTPTNLAAAAGSTLTTEPSTDSRFAATNGTLCRFVDVEYQGKTATLLLENPAGCSVTEYINEVLSTLFGSSVVTSKKLKNGTDVVELQRMTPEQWEKLNGKTVKLV